MSHRLTPKPTKIDKMVMNEEDTQKLYNFIDRAGFAGRSGDRCDMAGTEPLDGDLG